MKTTSTQQQITQFFNIPTPKNAVLPDKIDLNSTNFKDKRNYNNMEYETDHILKKTILSGCIDVIDKIVGIQPLNQCSNCNNELNLRTLYYEKDDKDHKKYCLKCFNNPYTRSRMNYEAINRSKFLVNGYNHYHIIRGELEPTKELLTSINPSFYLPTNIEILAPCVWSINEPNQFRLKEHNRHIIPKKLYHQIQNIDHNTNHHIIDTFLNYDFTDEDFITYLDMDIFNTPHFDELEEYFTEHYNKHHILNTLIKRVFNNDVLNRDHHTELNRIFFNAFYNLLLRGNMNDENLPFEYNLNTITKPRFLFNEMFIYFLYNVEDIDTKINHIGIEEGELKTIEINYMDINIKEFHLYTEDDRKTFLVYLKDWIRNMKNVFNIDLEYDIHTKYLTPHTTEERMMIYFKDDKDVKKYELVKQFITAYYRQFLTPIFKFIRLKDTIEDDEKIEFYQSLQHKTIILNSKDRRKLFNLTRSINFDTEDIFIGLVDEIYENFMMVLTSITRAQLNRFDEYDRLVEEYNGLPKINQWDYLEQLENLQTDLGNYINLLPLKIETMRKDDSINKLDSYYYLQGLKNNLYYGIDNFIDIV